MCTLDDFQKVPEKSRDGGCYGFASAEVRRVIQRG